MVQRLDRRGADLQPRVDGRPDPNRHGDQHLVPRQGAAGATGDADGQRTAGSATLSWGAATDDVGVVGYDVYRSTTSGFTPGAANRIAQPPGTGYSDAGLGAGTYFYRVAARDQAGNIGPPSNEASATVTADTDPPTVSLTAPTAGATISGAVVVSATAQDNGVVSGVQFKLDGANPRRGHDRPVFGAVEYDRRAERE